MKEEKNIKQTFIVYFHLINLLFYKNKKKKIKTQKHCREKTKFLLLFFFLFSCQFYSLTICIFKLSTPFPMAI